MPNVYHFAINADDIPNARRFYERVFGWKFSAWGPPKFYMVETAGQGERLESVDRCREGASSFPDSER